MFAMTFVNTVKRTKTLLRSKAVSGLATLLCLTLLLVIIVGSAGTGEDTVGAFGEERRIAVYAIAYRDMDEPAMIEMLKNDVAYMRSLGLDFILPDGISALSRNAVIIIIEDCTDAETTCALLDDLGIRAVLQPAPDMEHGAELLKNAVRDGELTIAAGIGYSDSLHVLSREITEARLEFFERFKLPCSCFIEQAELNFSDTGSSDPWKVQSQASVKTPEGVFLFTYGNGLNEISCDTRIINRIVRLPEWTIREYFDSIAVVSSQAVSSKTPQPSRRP